MRPQDICLVICFTSYLVSCNDFLLVKTTLQTLSYSLTYSSFFMVITLGYGPNSRLGAKGGIHCNQDL